MWTQDPWAQEGKAAVWLFLGICNLSIGLKHPVPWQGAIPCHLCMQVREIKNVSMFLETEGPREQ